MHKHSNNNSTTRGAYVGIPIGYLTYMHDIYIYTGMSRDNSTVRTRFLPDSRFTLTNYRFRGGTITHAAGAAEEAKTKFNMCNNSIDGVGYETRTTSESGNYKAIASR